MYIYIYIYKLVFLAHNGRCLTTYVYVQNKMSCIPKSNLCIYLLLLGVV